MKPPRWLVVCLLSGSLLVVLGAAGWWWITWPTRTAWQLIAQWDNGQFVDTNSMLVDAQWEKVNYGQIDMQLMVKGVKGGSFGLIQNRWQSCTRTRSNIGVALTKEIDGETEEQFAMLLRPRSLLDVTSGKQVLRLKTPLRDQNGRVVVDFVIQGRTARGEISFER